jgi:hypothetical protein
MVVFFNAKLASPASCFKRVATGLSEISLTRPHFSQIMKAIALVAFAGRMAAGDKGIEAFKPVDETELHQFVECAIHLERRAKAIIAQLVENGIGAKRPSAFAQRAHHQ